MLQDLHPLSLGHYVIRVEELDGSLGKRLLLLNVVVQSVKARGYLEGKCQIRRHQEKFWWGQNLILSSPESLKGTGGILRTLTAFVISSHEDLFYVTNNGIKIPGISLNQYLSII